MLDLDRLRFEYAGTPEMAASSLIQVIETQRWGSVVGEVLPEKVKLYPRVRWWTRSRGCSVFVGRFILTDDGCALIGRFRLEWPTLLVFLLILCIALGRSVATSELNPWPIAVPMFALGGLWILDALKRQEIVTVIEASI